MPARTPQAFVKKWAGNTVNNLQNMKDGVNAVTESPTAKAAAAEDDWVAGVRAARESGKFRERLQAVSLQTWKDAMIKKGAPRIADGVKEAEVKMNDFAAQLLQHTNMVRQEIAAMPKSTPQERKARMDRNYELMSQFKYIPRTR